MPLLAANAVSASQPLAAQAGLQMLREGGNAIDAALATAITLTVVEPVMNGIGGDLFAQVWHEGKLYGLNASGRAPAAWNLKHFAGRDAMPKTGWDTVTVPGQVAGWKALSERFGKLDFARLFAPAIAYASEGFLVSPQIARQWAAQVPVLAEQPDFKAAFLVDGRAPRAGERWQFADQARSLAEIAQSGGRSFYEGDLAARLVAHAAKTGGLMTAQDLANHRVTWVEPMSQDFRGHTLHELPPNGQGIAALIALGIVERFDVEAMGCDSPDFYHLCIEAMKLAFADLHAHVADGAHMQVAPAALLDSQYLASRAALIRMDRSTAAMAGMPKPGGTVYLATADATGNMVSFIQSNYRGFGSGIVVPGTGIGLHNRGESFSLQAGHPNCVAPGKQPLHTIIPGFVTRDGLPLMAFGVMGGSMQAQGHLQMMLRLASFRQNPQAMSDAPRFRVENGPVVHTEAHTPAAVVSELQARGHHVEVAPADSLEFGSAQLIHRVEGGYVAASDSRRDGQAVGF
jgi:gamma-glutamyltranspeptidase/glutathione hydrolase